MRREQQAAPSITVDTSDPTPPYEQLRRQLTDLITAGVLDEGARLPSVRQLAGDLRMAPGTVARAYKELEGAGLVTTGRGAGTRVAPGRVLAPELRLRRVEELAAGLVAEARRLGTDDSAVRAALEAALGQDRG